eukprot:CFRG7411T1
MKSDINEMMLHADKNADLKATLHQLNELTLELRYKRLRLRNELKRLPEVGNDIYGDVRIHDNIRTMLLRKRKLLKSITSLSVRLQTPSQQLISTDTHIYPSRAGKKVTSPLYDFYIQMRELYEAQGTRPMDGPRVDDIEWRPGTHAPSCILTSISDMDSESHVLPSTHKPADRLPTTQHACTQPSTFPIAQLQTTNTLGFVTVSEGIAVRLYVTETTMLVTGDENVPETNHTPVNTHTNPSTDPDTVSPHIPRETCSSKTCEHPSTSPHAQTPTTTSKHTNTYINTSSAIASFEYSFSSDPHIEGLSAGAQVIRSSKSPNQLLNEVVWALWKR